MKTSPRFPGYKFTHLGTQTVSCWVVPYSDTDLYIYPLEGENLFSPYPSVRVFVKGGQWQAGYGVSSVQGLAVKIAKAFAKAHPGALAFAKRLTAEEKLLKARDKVVKAQKLFSRYEKALTPLVSTAQPSDAVYNFVGGK